MLGSILGNFLHYGVILEEGCYGRCPVEAVLLHFCPRLLELELEGCIRDGAVGDIVVRLCI